MFVYLQTIIWVTPYMKKQYQVALNYVKVEENRFYFRTTSFSHSSFLIFSDHKLLLSSLIQTGPDEWFILFIYALD